MLTYTEQKPIPSSYQIINSFAAAVALGIVFGLFEGIVQWIRMLLGSPEPMGHEILWAAPTVYAAMAGIFAVFAIGLFLILNRILLRRNQLPTFVPILDLLLFIGFVNTILLIVPMISIASWVLALGLTKQAHVFFARHRQGTIGFLSSRAPILLALVCILFVLVSAGKKIHENAFLARLPPARPDAPNILLITLDTLRADHLSTYGYYRPTPNLDQFAKEGVQFDNAFATSSWTLPSHATVMTGLLSHEHFAERLTGEKLNREFLTLAEVYSENGYATAAIVANEISCAGTRGFNQGFSEYKDIFWGIQNLFRWTRLGGEISTSIRLNENFHWYFSGRKNAEEVNREFLKWLKQKPKKPFFVWLNYFDPHDPYYAPGQFAGKYGEISQNGNPGRFGETGPSGWGGTLTRNEILAQIDAYDSAIYYLDAQLGSLFKYLKRENLLGNTIVIITSDHGEAFGQHGLFGHANSLYRETLHVPLLIRYPPTIKPGEHISHAVSLVNLASTILELSEITTVSKFPGVSLFLMTKEKNFFIAELFHNPYHPPTHPISKGNLTSIFTTNWYAIFLDEVGELYSFEDRLDQINLANTQAGLKILTDLKILLDK